MQTQSGKVKRIVPVTVGGMTIGIILGQADRAAAIERVSASLARHGWLGGSTPREMVRVGGAV